MSRQGAGPRALLIYRFGYGHGYRERAGGSATLDAPFELICVRLRRIGTLSRVQGFGTTRLLCNGTEGRNVTRTFNSAFALTTALFLVATAPSDGQSTPVLDLSSPDATLPMDAAARIEPGMVIRLPDGATGVRIRRSGRIPRPP